MSGLRLELGLELGLEVGLELGLESGLGPEPRTTTASVDWLTGAGLGVTGASLACTK